jgi:hypothetical protein
MIFLNIFASINLAKQFNFVFLFLKPKQRTNEVKAK